MATEGIKGRDGYQRTRRSEGLLSENTTTPHKRDTVQWQNLPNLTTEATIGQKVSEDVEQFIKTSYTCPKTLVARHMT